MSRMEGLINEINNVQNAINSANTLMKTPPTHFGADFTKEIQEKGGAYAAKLAPQVSKAVNSGRIESVIIGGTVFAVAWAGAYAIDGISKLISVAKAKKVLLAYYEELGVKQNMLIDEQQKLIERIDSENNRIESEIQKDKAKLRYLTLELNRIAKLFAQRTV